MKLVYNKSTKTFSIKSSKTDGYVVENEDQYRNSFLDAIFGMEMDKSFREEWFVSSWGTHYHDVKHKVSLDPLRGKYAKPNEFFGSRPFGKHLWENVEKLVGKTLAFLSTDSYHGIEYRCIGKVIDYRNSTFNPILYVHGICWFPGPERSNKVYFNIGDFAIEQDMNSALVIREVAKKGLMKSAIDWVKNNAKPDNHYISKAPWFDKVPQKFKQKLNEIYSIVPEGILIFNYSGIGSDAIDVTYVKDGEYVEGNEFYCGRNFSLDKVAKYAEELSNRTGATIYDLRNYLYSRFSSYWIKDETDKELPKLNIPCETLSDWKGFKGIIKENKNNL